MIKKSVESGVYEIVIMYNILVLTIVVKIPNRIRFAKLVLLLDGLV